MSEDDLFGLIDTYQLDIDPARFETSEDLAAAIDEVLGALAEDATAEAEVEQEPEPPPPPARAPRQARAPAVPPAPLARTPRGATPAAPPARGPARAPAEEARARLGNLKPRGR